MEGSSSTSSSEARELEAGGRPGRSVGRALGTGWLLLVLLLALGTLEAAVQLQPRKPGHQIDRLREYQKQILAGHPHVVAFGTCLGDAVIPSVVERTWGTGVKVVTLTSRASTSLDWYLVLGRHMKPDPSLRAAIVAFGGDDLSLRPSPWESQVMNLATWRDIPALVRTSCDSPSCAMELVLRKLSFAYRFRGILGYRFWSALGTYTPGPKLVRPRGPGPGSTDGEADVPPMPVTPIQPRVFAGPPPPNQPPPPGAPPGMPGMPPGQRMVPSVAATAPPPAFAQPMNAASVGGNDPKAASGTSSSGSGAGEALDQGMGWHLENSWLKQDNDPYYWVKKMLAVGQARRLKMLFVPLPGNPTWRGAPRGWSNPKTRAEIQQVIEAGGGELLELGELPDLSGACFTDDVHFTPHGGDVIATAIGRALAKRLPERVGAARP